MINILYLHAGSELYGADRILLELVVGLDKKIFHPIVVLPSKGRLSNKLNEADIENYVVDYPILRRKYFNIKGVVNYIFSYGKSVNKIIGLVRDKNINLIHVNTTAVLEGILLKKKLRVPLLWHIHEIIEHPKIIVKVTDFLIGRYSDKIVAVSKSVKDNLEKSKYISSNKIQVIYNGVDNNIYNNKNETKYLYSEFQIPPKSIRVGMIGRVNSWKGQRDFLRAISPILYKNAEVYAFLVGGVFSEEGWRLSNLKREVSNNPFCKQIRVINFRTDTPNFHNFFDIFVLPSTAPDPLPTVVLEAMATGKPIVGYRHGGVTEMVKEGENGMLADPNNIEDLSIVIGKLIKSKKLREQMGDSSFNREKILFSKDAFLERFSNLYMKILFKDKG